MSARNLNTRIYLLDISMDHSYRGVRRRLHNEINCLWGGFLTFSLGQLESFHKNHDWKRKKISTKNFHCFLCCFNCIWNRGKLWKILFGFSFVGVKFNNLVRECQAKAMIIKYWGKVTVSRKNDTHVPQNWTIKRYILWYDKWDDHLNGEHNGLLVIWRVAMTLPQSKRSNCLLNNHESHRNA